MKRPAEYFRRLNGPPRAEGKENGMKKRLAAAAVVLLAVLCALPALAGGKHLAANFNFVAAVMQDGTVRAAGDNVCGQCDTQAWRDVIAVAAGYSHTLGLKKDGTVYAAGDNAYGQCDVSGWKNIVMVAAGFSESYGLTRDGRVLTTSREDTRANRDIAAWRDIVWIDQIWWYLYAIDKDGRGYGAGLDQLDIRDAVQIDESSDGIYVLKKDGTVVCDLSYMDPPIFMKPSALDWQDVAEINSDGDMLGIKRDGTLAGKHPPSVCDGWRDIAEMDEDFAVRADGTVLFTASPAFSDADWEDICSWKVMVDPKRAAELGVKSGHSADTLPDDLLLAANGMRLKGQTVDFEEGSKYAVYTGPGREYLRAGNGQALVSTKGRIRVYGVENGWALIQYAISKGRLRIGYIPTLTLPMWAMDSKRFKLMNLSAQAETAAVLRDTAITDDPNGSGEALALLMAGQEGVLYLGELDGKWAYVQAADGEGVPFRGFVPFKDVMRSGMPAAPVCVVPEGTQDIWTNASLAHHFFDAKADYFVVPDNARAVRLPASVHLPVYIDGLMALKNLTEIEVSPDSTQFESIGGVLYSKGGGMLVLYPSGRTDRSYTLPEGTVSAVSTGCDLSNADRIETIILPSTMTDVWALTKLPALQRYEVAEGNPAYKAIDGVLFSKDGTVLVAYPPARPGDTYAVPAGTKQIGMNAFAETSPVKHVILPEGLELIDMNAFASHDSLESVVFPNTLTRIDEGAFTWCTQLKSVDLPSSLEDIGFYAFAWSGLEGELHIPEGVTYIGSMAIESIAISDLYLPASLEMWEPDYSDSPYENATDGQRGPTVHAPRGSWAAAFAKESGFRLVLEEP